MGRAVYSYELDDPDFSWLISKFREEHPNYSLVDSSTLPLTLIESVETRAESPASADLVPVTEGLPAPLAKRP